MDGVSASGYRVGADAYAAGRPGWPPAVVELAFAEWGIDPADGLLVDLAAGTGRLTRRLAERCGDVLAIEPVNEMRAHIGVAPAVDGTAEALPLDDGVASAVFVAEAFHWFDQRRAVREIARVLRPGGGLAVMWNTRVGDHPWNAELTELLEPHHYHPVGRGLRAGDPREDTAWQRGDHWHGWGPMTHRTVEHAEQVTRERVVMRIASFSYIAALDADTRANVLARADEILKQHGADEYEEQWRCDLYLRQLQPVPGGR